MSTGKSGMNAKNPFEPTDLESKIRRCGVVRYEIKMLSSQVNKSFYR